MSKPKKKRKDRRLETELLPATGLAGRPLTDASRTAILRGANESAQQFYPSWETWCWVLIGLVAAMLRLASLGSQPLSPSESDLALASWQMLHGLPFATSGGSLLIYGNAIAFLLLGSNDGAARLLPALAGIGIAMLPLGLRQELGRLGSLAAGVMLALSPTLVFLSRQVSATNLAIFFAFLGIVLASRQRAHPRHGTLVLAGILAAFFLCSGPIAIALLACGLVGSVLWFGARGLWSLVMGNGFSLGISRLPLPSRHQLSVFAVSYFLVSTAAFTNLAGLGGALADALTAFTDAIRLGIGGGTALPQLAMFLILYEPTALLFGIIGTIVAFQRPHGFARFLVGWLIGGCVVSGLLAPPTMFFGLLLVPMFLLGGLQIEALLGLPAIRQALLPAGAALLGGVVLVILGVQASSILALAKPVPPLSTGILPFSPLVGYAALCASRYGYRAVGKGAIALAFVAFMCFEVHGTLLLNLAQPPNPSEPLRTGAPAPDIYTLAHDTNEVLDVLTIDRQNENRQVANDVVVSESLRSPLAWYLRAIPTVRLGNLVGDAPAIAITPATSKEQPQGSYTRQRYRLSTTRPAQLTNWGEVWRYWLYRESPAKTESTDVWLWVRSQTGAR